MIRVLAALEQLQAAALGADDGIRMALPGNRRICAGQEILYRRRAPGRPHAPPPGAAYQGQLRVPTDATHRDIAYHAVPYPVAYHTLQSARSCSWRHAVIHVSASQKACSFKSRSGCHTHADIWAEVVNVALAGCSWPRFHRFPALDWSLVVIMKSALYSLFTQFCPFIGMLGVISGAKLTPDEHTRLAGHSLMKLR